MLPKGFFEVLKNKFYAKRLKLSFSFSVRYVRPACQRPGELTKENGTPFFDQTWLPETIAGLLPFSIGIVNLHHKLKCAEVSKGNEPVC